jgi:hypothetical protein
MSLPYPVSTCLRMQNNEDVTPQWSLMFPTFRAGLQGLERMSTATTEIGCLLAQLRNLLHNLKLSALDFVPTSFVGTKSKDGRSSFRTQLVCWSLISGVSALLVSSVSPGLPLTLLKAGFRALDHAAATYPAASCDSSGGRLRLNRSQPATHPWAVSLPRGAPALAQRCPDSVLRT